jgi:hypothetical protein
MSMGDLTNTRQVAAKTNERLDPFDEPSIARQFITIIDR